MRTRFRSLSCALLVSLFIVGCGQIPSTDSGFEDDGNSHRDRAAFAVAVPDTEPVVLPEIVATATAPTGNWSSFNAWVMDSWLNQQDYLPTPTTFYDVFPNGGNAGTPGVDGTPAPTTPKPAETPIKIDSVGTMCPDQPTRNIVCIDAWISKSGQIVFRGDNRGLTPYADTTLSRVQMIIDLNNPSASKAYVSPTCLIGHIACFGPLGPEYNYMQVTLTGNGHYSVSYNFTNAYGPVIDGMTNLPVTPAIAGFVEFRLNSEGWVELVGPWSHSAFPDIAMWHFRYGYHNRRLIAADQETSFRDFMLGKFHDTYTRQPIN